MDINDSTFTGNFAERDGGAIKWDMLEPIISEDTIFNSNSANYYGDNIASYANKLAKLTVEEYEKAIAKVTTAEAYVSDANAVEEHEDHEHKRRLEESQVGGSVEELKSGGNIPLFYIALVD